VAFASIVYLCPAAHYFVSYEPPAKLIFMNIEVWSLGKENDAYIEKGIQFYLNRLKPFCKTGFVLLPPPKRSANTTPEESKLLEEKIILSRFDETKHALILLDETGKMLTSESWAEEIEKLQISRAKTVIFLIGGPWGVSDKIKQMAQKTWSLSKLTFPHQLVRLIIAEQLYRSFSILNNSGYHHR